MNFVKAAGTEACVLRPKFARDGEGEHTKVHCREGSRRWTKRNQTGIEPEPELEPEPEPQLEPEGALRSLQSIERLVLMMPHDDV